MNSEVALSQKFVNVLLQKTQNYTPTSVPSLNVNTILCSSTVTESPLLN